MELNPRQKHLLTTVWDFRAYLIVPAIAGMFLALVYVFVIRSQSWTSRQRLLVRDDLLGQSFKPGQFSSFDTMKSRQETILDIARNPNVIRGTLQQLGPATKSWFFGAGNYPDDSTIEQLQGQINLSAPNGAEFGTTEVVVLSVKASSSSRSADLIRTLLDEIEKQIEQVRNSQLQSMEAELTAARDNARKSLQESIEQLKQMELTLGPDSLAMATMTSTMPGDNSIKSEMLQIQAEKRGFEAQLESLQSSRKTLEQSRENPLLVVSNTGNFFREQAKLGELAKSLVESQKSYAIAAGKYHEVHPLVQHAAEQLLMMENQVASELLVLESSLDSRISELEHQIERLDDQLEHNHQRLKTLNEKRGEHLAINSEIAKRTEILNQYEVTLKNVQSSKGGTGNTVWATRIGEPQVAAQPDGMSKRSTVFAGGVLGLLFGAGLIVLLAPSPPADTVQQPNGNSTAAAPSLTAQATPSRPRTAPAPARTSSDSAPPRETEIRIPKLPNPELQPAATHATNVQQPPTRSLPSASPTPTDGTQSTRPISIPNVTAKQDPEIEQLEHLIEKMQVHEEPAVEIANRDYATQSTTLLNANTVLLDPANPDDLLATLRAKRAMETDPLAKRAMDVSSPGSPASTGSLEENAIQQISQLQKAIGTVEPLERRLAAVANSISSANAVKSMRAKVLTSIPEQVRSISDSILGLVQTETRRS